MIREVARQLFESLLRLRVAALGGRGVGVDQQRVSAPRRVTGRHLLQQQMRRPRELTQVARAVVAELEQAQRRLDQLLVLGPREHDVAALVFLGRVAIEHQLEVGCGRQGLVLIHQAHAGEVRRRRRLGLERIAGHHRLIAAGRIGAPAHGVERARHAVLSARRDLVLEVLREHAVELDDRLGRLALGHQGFAHQELGARRHIAARVALGHAAQHPERGVGPAREEHGSRGAQLGFGFDRGVAHLGTHTRELLGGAAIVAGLEKRVRLGEQGVIAKRRVGVALADFLEGGGRLEQRSLGFQAHRLEIESRRAHRLRPEQRERVVDLSRGVRHHGLGENQALVFLHPGVGRSQTRDQLLSRRDLTPSHRVPDLCETRRRHQRTRREALLPLDPGARRLRIAALGLECFDRRERRVVGKAALAVFHRFAERLCGFPVVAELVLDLAGEEAGRGALIGVHIAT